MNAYFSPAANDGNDGNRSGCFGRGDSLHELLHRLQRVELRYTPEVRVMKSLFRCDPHFRVVGKHRGEEIDPGRR
jgi:hypothetical protein